MGSILIPQTIGGTGGVGDLDGPASSTDNAVARFDSTTGKLLQNGVVIIDDSGNVSGTGTVDGRDVAADGTKLDGIEALADVTDETNVAATASVIANTAKVTNVSTDLSVGTTTATAMDVNSSDGTNATLPQAIATSAAGLLSGADKAKLDGIEALADVTDETNVAATASVIANTAKVTNVSTDLSIGTTTATAMDVNSSDGTNATLPQAIATSAAGLLSGADKAKLDGVEASADVTDETNVVSSLDGATLTGVTVATGDKVLLQDVDDSDNLKTVTAQAIADLGLTGSNILQNVLKLTATITTTTSQHSIDDTILQSTEVASILSQAVTPISASSRIYVFVEIPMFTYTVTNTMQVGIFDGAGDCFWSGMATGVGGAVYQGYNLMGYQASGSTSARTYSFGVTSDIAGTLTLNGYNAARQLGGRVYLSMLILEVG